MRAALQATAFLVTAAAVTATSPPFPMQIGFNVDLSDRERAVYAVRTLDAPDAGSIDQIVVFSAVGLAPATPAAIDAGTSADVVLELVVAASPSLPTPEGLSQASSSGLRIGDQRPGLGQVLLATSPRLLSGGQQQGLGDARLTLGTAPLYLSFVRGDGGAVVLPLRFMRAQGTCDNSTCPELVFDDVTADVR